jgi:hypothetical protein
MKKLSCLLLLVSNCIIAQINFEKGYFIDNNGEKKECLIKNEDWKSNPEMFYYKTDENAQPNEKTIQSVKEFGIDAFSKYERHEVLIDTSGSDIARLSITKEPEWSKKTLFLKLIVDGDAKLYLHVSRIGRRYFYSYKGSAIEQLIYKEYYNNNKKEYVYQNKNFQQQLWNNVKCTNIPKTRIAKVDYKTNSLIKYFYEVNSCDGNTLVTSAATTPKSSGSTNFKIKGGMNFSKLDLEYYNGQNTLPVDFEKKVGAKIGVEVEYVLGFNRNKWSIFYEPTYQSYASEAEKVFSPYLTTKWSLDYKYIDHYFGFKHYMFLNDEAKISLSTGVVYKQPLGNKVLKVEEDKSPDPSDPYPDATDRDYSLDIESRLGLMIGLGFSYKKSDLEIRYSQPDILQQYFNVHTRFNTISIIYGHKIFDSKKK